jgi:hypothetical protein
LDRSLASDACHVEPISVISVLLIADGSHFIDEETLAATLAHEAEHVLQYAAGYVPGSGDREAMEAAARAAEAPAVAFILGVEL